MNILLVLIISLFVLFPLGQLNRLPSTVMGVRLIGYPEVNAYLLDLVVAGLGGFWFIWKLVRKSKFVLPPLAKPIFIFLIFAFLSLMINTPLLSGREVVVAGLYLARWIVYAGLYFVISDLVRQPGKQRTKTKNLITRLLIGAGSVSAIFGLWQYFFLPNTKFLKYLHWDPHYYRVIGTFLDPAFLGMIIVLTLILLIAHFWQEITKPKKLFIVPYSLFLIDYLALALTYSRSSYLAYLVGMGTLAWVKKTPKFFMIILLMGILTLLVLPQPSGEGGKLERTYTIEARVKNWHQSLTIISDHPLLGVGFNAYRYAQRDYGFLVDDWQASHAGAGADSSLLFVLATTGILGFGAYLWLWGKTLKTDSLVILASSTALLVHSFFNNSLFYPWIMVWMWALLGVYYQEKL